MTTAVNKKANEIKTCVIKRRLKFEHCQKCLQNNKTSLRSQPRFKSETHNVFTEDINKFALSSNDNMRLQTLMELNHIHLVHMLEKYAKQNCCNI